MGKLCDEIYDWNVKIQKSDSEINLLLRKWQLNLEQIFKGKKFTECDQDYYSYYFWVNGELNNGKVYVAISTDLADMDVDGDVGIEWIDIDYADKGIIGFKEIEDMEYILQEAERILLMDFGVPFSSDYVFHQGKKQAEFIMRNRMLRGEFELNKIADLREQLLKEMDR